MLFRLFDYKNKSYIHVIIINIMMKNITIFTITIIIITEAGGFEIASQCLLLPLAGVVLHPIASQGENIWNLTLNAEAVACGVASRCLLVALVLPLVGTNKYTAAQKQLEQRQLEQKLRKRKIVVCTMVAISVLKEIK